MSLINEALAGRPLVVVGILQPTSALFAAWWLSIHGVSRRDVDIVLLPLGVRELRVFGRTSVASPSGDLSVGSEEGRPEAVGCNWGGLVHVGIPAIVG